MCDTLYDILIGLCTGVVSGWLSSVLVTKFYRKKDNERDKDNFIRDLKRHIISIYRILRAIELSSNDEEKIEQIENLRRELLYAPSYENRFLISKDEEKMISEYKKNLKNIKDEISEYSRCKNVISILEKYPDNSDEKKRLGETRNQYKLAISRLGTYNSIWLMFVHDISD